ncbi:MAG: DUF362 domain-containing protein [Chloroflexota bacterium]|nr:DUF362 domain-containing protein [Chloroflexota bacterium]
MKANAMNRSKVALVRCETYEDEDVLRAVRTGIDLLGGSGAFAQPGERIVLKPNVLVGVDPTKCVTTHPSVLRAVATLLKEAGANVSYGDSPSVGMCQLNLRRAGLKQVGDELGIELAEFDTGRTVAHADALLIKSFVVANGVLDADALVSLPKLKTHPLTRFTGAVKNQFGCIPGVLKSRYHVKLPDPYHFATMLVDLNTLIRPRLAVMDGIVAMEGNGPRSGTPKALGVLLLSSDLIALDATACRLIALDPEFVPTSKPGEESGLGRYHEADIEIVGEPLESFYDPEFDAIRTAPAPCAGGRWKTFIKNRTCERPVIDESKCTNCGTCVDMCPVSPRAVDWHSGDASRPPSHRYDWCIRCFCCQEVCPAGAITVQTPILGRMFFRA